MIRKRCTLLSFDAEEFDLPQEYNQSISSDLQFETSKAGLDAIARLLDDLQIRATFFVTAAFASRFPSAVAGLAHTHEIASHGVSHSASVALQKSKALVEEISGRPVYGYRSARLKPVDNRALQEEGYKYNASMNPTFIPGRYNHIFRPRRIYQEQGILNVPVSVTPMFRIPLFWLSFKRLPLSMIKFLSSWTLERDGYLSLYYHPWEFTDIGAFSIPRYIKTPCGERLLDRLRAYLTWLKQRSEFETIFRYLTVAGWLRI